MSQDTLDKAFGGWFSSYGLLTVDRVLSYYRLKLSKEVLYSLVKNKKSALYFFLQVPMKNIFNGIILQQAYDYQTYVMKLMIDYRLSPESSLADDAPGASLREALNEQFQAIDTLNQAFLTLETEYYQLISETQKELIALFHEVSDEEHIERLATHPEAVEKVHQYLVRAERFFNDFSSFREAYYQHIVLSTERFSLLPDYHFDLELAKKDRESLAIAKEIGMD